MANRPQPYRVTFPLTASQVENIDTMFGTLFKASVNQSTATSTAISISGDSILSDNTGLTNLFSHQVDVSNSGSGETDLENDSLAVATFAADGDVAFFEYAGTIQGSTSTSQRIRVYFGGTVIYDTTAIVYGITTSFTCRVGVQRVSSSSVRCSTTFTPNTTVNMYIGGKALDTVYGPVDTDGFVVVQLENNAGADQQITVLTDASNPPTTQHGTAKTQKNVASGSTCSIPVLKGWYWKVHDVIPTATGSDIQWVPLSNHTTITDISALDFSGSLVVKLTGQASGSTQITAKTAKGTAVLQTTANISSINTGDILYGSSTNVVGKLPDVATGNALISGGILTAPLWGKIGLTTHVSGILPIANGGTGISTSPTAGGVVYGNGTTYGITAAGSAGQILTSAGGGTPVWAAAAAATAHNVLSVTHSDTLADSVVQGDLLLGNVTPKWSRLAIGSASTVLRSTGTTAAWGQVVLTTDVSGILPVANGGTGPSLTTGSILFAGGTGFIAQDNSNLFWDNTSKFLGVGTTSPVEVVTVKGTSISLALQAAGSSQVLGFKWYNHLGSLISSITSNTGVGDFTFNPFSAAAAVTIKNTTGRVGIGTTSPSFLLDVNGTAQIAGVATLSSGFVATASRNTINTIGILGATEASLVFTRSGTVKWDIGLGAWDFSDDFQIQNNANKVISIGQSTKQTDFYYNVAINEKEVWLVPAATAAANVTAIQTFASAGYRIHLSAGTFDFDSLLNLSGSIVSGLGWNTTILRYTGTVVNTAKIKFNTSAGGGLKDLKLDCNGVALGSGGIIDNGLTIENNAADVELENLWIYDTQRSALIVPNVNGCRIRNLKISKVAVTSAIFIGQFPASYGLPVNKDCKNIFCSDVYIEDIQSDAFGIWNCSGGDGYTTVCENININGLTVKKWGQSGLGYAFWGSGITTYATDVNLSNFVFDNAGADATNNIGAGLHIEHGVRWNHSNGTMRNMVTGVADTRLGYAITCPGGSFLTYDNILVDNCGIGVQTNGATEGCFSNITVTNSLYQSFYVGGTKLKFTNCSGSHTLAAGRTDSAWGFNATNPVYLDDITLDHCYGRIDNSDATSYAFDFPGPDFSAGMKFTDCTSGNTLAFNTRGNPNHEYLHGTLVSVPLPDSVAAGTDYEIPILLSPLRGLPGNRVFIFNAYLTFSAGIAVDATNYNTYHLYKRASNGGSPVALSSTGLVTKTDDFSTAFVTNRLKIQNYDNAHIAVGETLTMKKTHASSGKAESGGILTIEYVSY